MTPIHPQHRRTSRIRRPGARVRRRRRCTSTTTGDVPATRRGPACRRRAVPPAVVVAQQAAAYSHTPHQLQSMPGSRSGSPPIIFRRSRACRRRTWRTRMSVLRARRRRCCCCLLRRCGWIRRVVGARTPRMRGRRRTMVVVKRWDLDWGRTRRIRRRCRARSSSSRGKERRKG
ncbi:hypothetical protein BDZ97DRAFT_571801 [Flammula alnicola]|nr:hypothetical protein BDZ97DRAFT_571801 [Flammula alnicola]